jgi:tRNA threonylcarbamoyladenosine biosynthesis protein TsaE
MENFSKKDFKNKFHNVVGLSGDLGAGKTTFTKHLLKKLGYTGSVPSPTFVLRRDYELNDKNFKRLIHIDAYRLNGGKELQILGFEELINNTNNLIVIEWPENVIDILPENHIKIHCEFVNENSRKFDVQ